jgi:uncharacterized protein (DUF58 family)
MRRPQPCTMRCSLPAAGRGQGVGVIFRQIWLMVAVLLLLVGIGIREPAVAAVGALVALTGGLARLWSRLSLERVGYRRTLHHRRAFVGEEIAVGFSVANRKALPLAWIEVREAVPDALPARDAHTSPSSSPGEVYVTRSTALAWYERVSWQHRFLCRQRGYYHFGPARLRSGDIFGLFPSEVELPRRDYFTVLPRTVSLPALGLPTERPFGEARTGLRIFEDPSRILGVRDYRPGDPLKRIDWKATARRQALQSRVYEPSSALHLLVALNVNTLEYVWEGYDPVRLERAITVAASIARWADEQRYAVGLIANSSYPGADRPLSIPPGRDPEQLTRILEALAMVSPFTIAPLEDVLEDTARRLPLGATVVLVAAFLPEALATRVVRLRARGHPLALLWVADDPPPHDLPGVIVYDLAPRMRLVEREWLADLRPFTPPVERVAATGTGLAAAPAPVSTTLTGAARSADDAEPEPPAPAAPARGPGTRRDERDPVARWARPD